ncbi:MAG: cation diffusion facilitator family transporter [Phycisphaerales bacterium JB064]
MPADVATADAHLRRNTIAALVASVLLAAGKFVAGVLGHSTALVADGVESLADAIGSVIVWQGLRVAGREPDERHPYGYGRAETVAALLVGALLLLAALLIVGRAFEEIVRPHRAPAAWTLLALVGVIVVKEGLFRLLLRGAELYESPAARADAWHHRSDAITSAAAFVGVAVAVWGPGLTGVPELVLADEIAAMLASGIIVVTALRLIRPSLLELLDASAHDLAERVAKTAAATPGVVRIEKAHARRAGRGVLVDMHLHVDGDLDVRTAHAIAGRAKAAVLAAHREVVHVLVHVEPDEPDPANEPERTPPSGTP